MVPQVSAYSAWMVHGAISVLGKGPSVVSKDEWEPEFGKDPSRLVHTPRRLGLANRSTRGGRRSGDSPQHPEFRPTSLPCPSCRARVVSGQLRQGDDGRVQHWRVVRRARARRSERGRRASPEAAFYAYDRAHCPLRFAYGKSEGVALLSGANFGGKNKTKRVKYIRRFVGG